MVPSPAGYGQGHLVVAQHALDESQVIAVPPAAPAAPAVLAMPPAAPAVLLPPPALVLPLPAVA
jgi:hypothetical protein